MARPIKSGLDYFPFYVNFFDDEILIAISGEFGIKGELTVVKLLCAVYSKGYFAVWSDLLKAKIAKQVQASPDLVDQIVARLVAWGLFDKGLYDSAKVLTSVSIQETFLEATKRRKSQKPSEFWINDGINPVSTGVNVYINPQSKVKESKVNKTKVQDGLSGGRAHEKSAFDRWQEVWGFPNAVAQQDLADWVSEFGDELVTWVIDYAARRAVQARAADKYLDRVLTQYREQDIKTVEQAEAEAKQHEKTAKANAPRPQRYGKPARQETTPDWAKPDYKAPEVSVTDDQQEEIQARLAALKKLEESKSD